MYERTNEHQHKAVSSILSLKEKTSYIQQMYAGTDSVAKVHQSNGLAQYTPPGFSFQNLYRCTINISAPSNKTVPMSHSKSFIESSEVEIDKLFATTMEPDQL